MSLNQFFITFLIALIIGVLLSNVGRTLFTSFVKYYRKLTFHHVLLTPYTPNKKKKGSK